MAKDEEIICPFCNSDNAVRKKQPGILAMLSVLLMGLPLPIFKKTFYCFDCDKEWKKGDVKRK